MIREKNLREILEEIEEKWGKGGRKIAEERLKRNVMWGG